MGVFDFIKKRSINKVNKNKDNRDKQIEKTENSEQIIVVNDSESFMRKEYNKSHNIPYKALKNLDEAKKFDNAYVIFEGDCGGTIYLTCPVNKVKCNDKELQDLLKYIEEHYWNDLSIAGVYFEIVEENQKSVAGGMGGGKIDKELWINPEITKLEIADKIKETMLKCVKRDGKF